MSVTDSANGDTSSAFQYKQELAIVRNQDIDISNFEDNLMKVKDMILKEALQEKRAETARTVSDYGSGNEVPQGV